MIIAISWKNIWRNKVRSGVILTAIILGVVAGIFNMGLYFGMAEQRINSAIKTEASHIQVHHPEFLSNPDTKFQMESTEEICRKIEEIPSVIAASPRLIINAMASSAETGSGIKLTGIDPEREKQVTNLYEKVIEGAYLEGVKKNPVLIGKKLAEKLNISLKSKIIVTLQHADGSITSGAFRVAGIYKTSNSVFDESSVFVKKDDLERLSGITPGNTHEIAVLLNDNNLTNVVKEKIIDLYPDLDVKTWKKIMPEVSIVEDSISISLYIFMIIILLALGFGIVNTMLMAVLERTKEIGMLMAIGMKKGKVFAMIMMETILMSLTGGVVGMTAGYLLLMFFHKKGIDLSMWGKAWEAMGYDSIVYPVLTMNEIVTTTMLIALTGFLSSIYPARKALKLKPAEAIRIDN